MPPPGALAAYQAIDPTFPERILAMAERSLAHEMDMDQKHLAAITGDRRESRRERRRGQVSALVISLAFVTASVICAVTGHDWVAGVLGGATVVGLVTVFVTGRALPETGRASESQPSQTNHK